MAEAWNEIPDVPKIHIRRRDDKSDDDDDDDGKSSHYDYGPVLHRWGNAFPKGEALPEELSVVPSSRVAFCGDYVASLDGIRVGSFESALLMPPHVTL